jgi:hypothetical protein
LCFRLFCAHLFLTAAYDGYSKTSYGAQGGDDSGGFFAGGGSQQGSQGGGGKVSSLIPRLMLHTSRISKLTYPELDSHTKMNHYGP